MQVFYTFRPFHRIITVYNFDNFRNINDHRVIIRNIYDAIVIFLSFLMYFIAVALNCWTCFFYEFDLHRNAHQLVALLCTAPMLLIHILITKNSHQITNVIIRLQGSVERRKFLVIFSDQSQFSRKFQLFFVSKSFSQSNQMKNCRPIASALWNNWTEILVSHSCIVQGRSWHIRLCIYNSIGDGRLICNSQSSRSKSNVTTSWISVCSRRFVSSQWVESVEIV